MATKVMNFTSKGILNALDVALDQAQAVAFPTVIGEYVSSNEETEYYSHFGAVPQMSVRGEGGRNAKRPKQYDWNIKNVKYSAAIDIPLDWLRRDKTSKVQARINELAATPFDHWMSLTTTLLEIGPGQTSHQYTGRAMVIPNSFLFSHPLTNETYTKKFRLHIITIPLTTDDDWKTAEQLLLTAGQEEAAPFIKEAERYLKNLEGKLWLDAPTVEPRVTIQLPEPGRINLLLRVPCPTQYPSRLEQAILKKFLSEFQFAPRIALPDPLLAHRSDSTVLS